MQIISRRQFGLQLAAGSLAAAASAAPARRPKPVVGSQLYGWGQYYDREGRDLQKNLDEVFKALKDSGYDYAEGSLDAHTPDNNARFADRLRRAGLRPVSLYTGGAFHTQEGSAQTLKSLGAAARVAKKAGFEVLVCNTDPIGRDKTDDELKIQSGALNALGADLKSIGMGLAIHHHTPEMRQNAREFHYNFTHGPAGIVDFCFDVHWVYRGGLAPEKALSAYHDRVISWHLRQSRDQIWWEDLDTGDVDYAGIAKTVAEKKIPQRFTVELALEGGTKITRSVVQNHQRSRAFVRRVFGV